MADWNTSRKPRRIEDEAFLVFVRSRRCSVPGCINPDTDPHHTITRGAGGSDHFAIPLCRQHHDEIHSLGKHRFETDHGIDLWAVSARILSMFILRTQGRLPEFVDQFRRIG